MAQHKCAENFSALLNTFRLNRPAMPIRSNLLCLWYCQYCASKCNFHGPTCDLMHAQFDKSSCQCHTERQALMNATPTAHPVLAVGLYALDFANADAHQPPSFPGNHWRGALGHALRDLACITGARTCEDCKQTHACAYAYLFETPPPADTQKMRRYDRAPHPFTLRETEGPSGVRLILSLFGRGNAYLPLMVLALRRAALAARGIGGRRMTLEKVCQAQSDQAHIWTRIDEAAGTLAPLTVVSAHDFPACPLGMVELRLLSPLRVKRDGRLVAVNNFRFADLFGNLLRRISMLTYFHTAERHRRHQADGNRGARGVSRGSPAHLLRPSAAQRSNSVVFG